eukprot:g10941.t1
MVQILAGVDKNPTAPKTNGKNHTDAKVLSNQQRYKAKARVMLVTGRALRLAAAAHEKAIVLSVGGCALCQLVVALPVAAAAQEKAIVLSVSGCALCRLVVARFLWLLQRLCSARKSYCAVG